MLCVTVFLQNITGCTKDPRVKFQKFWTVFLEFQDTNEWAKKFRETPIGKLKQLGLRDRKNDEWGVCSGDALHYVHDKNRPVRSEKVCFIIKSASKELEIFIDGLMDDPKAHTFRIPAMGSGTDSTSRPIDKKFLSNDPITRGTDSSSGHEFFSIQAPTSRSVSLVIL